MPLLEYDRKSGYVRRAGAVPRCVPGRLVDSAGDWLKIRPLAAGIAQLVEHDLAKVGVASSSLVSRSKYPDARPCSRAFLYRRRARVETRIAVAAWFAG